MTSLNADLRSGRRFDTDMSLSYRFTFDQISSTQW